MSKCKCGYERKRKQRVKGSACPGCGRKPVSFVYKLKKAWRAFKSEPLKNHKENSESVGLTCADTHKEETAPHTSVPI